jgi:hypothetical protein
MLNLCLVVISSHFAETKERELAKMKMERRNNCSTSVADTELLSKSIYRQIIEYVGHLYHLSKRRLVNSKFYRTKKAALFKGKYGSSTIEENQQSRSRSPLCPKHGNLMTVDQDLIVDGKVVLLFDDQQAANYTTTTASVSRQQLEQSSSPGKLLLSNSLSIVS